MRKLAINVVVSVLVALPGPAETSHADTISPGPFHQAIIANTVPTGAAQSKANAHPKYGLAKARKLDVEPVSETGLASWYGDQFNGRATANGEIFDKDGLTAAHPLLPLGTWIKVTNRSNHRSLVLRINDRGPYVEGRVVDLSEGAARRLGYIDAGLAHVDIQVVKPPKDVSKGRATSANMDSR
jgi:peptidoglycan lytic transglycosylase